MRGYILEGMMIADKRMKSVKYSFTALFQAFCSKSVSAYVIRNFVCKLIFWENALPKELSNAVISRVPWAYDSHVIHCQTTAEHTPYLRHVFFP